MLEFFLPLPDALAKIFPARPFLIGMVHLPALPGSPNYSGRFNDIVKFALGEAGTLEKCGFHAV